MAKLTRILFYLILLVVASCKKSEDDAPEPVITDGLNIVLNHYVGGTALSSNTISYTNSAGNNYGVTRLQYYLSGFEFETMNGVVYTFNNVYYIDAFSGNASIYIPSVPLAHYKRVKFYIGMDSLHNITDALPNTLENVNMAWPDMMGGGYHFMKLEGNYLASGSTTGFAMHLGMNGNLVTNNFTAHFESTAADNTIQLNMDINEWFNDPYIYDFNIDGNYSMSDSAAMAKLSANGYNVFKVIQ